MSDMETDVQVYSSVSSLSDTWANNEGHSIVGHRGRQNPLNMKVRFVIQPPPTHTHCSNTTYTLTYLSATSLIFSQPLS